MTKQNGNALFLILIAVALFAALSYAVTQSGRGGGNIDRETASIQAAQIIQFSGLLRAEVQRAKMLNNVSVENLDFGSDIYRRWTDPPATWADNPNCLSTSCRIFQSKGGHVPEPLFPEATLSWSLSHSSTHPHPGHPVVTRADLVGMGTGDDDLVLLIIRLREDVCDALNRELGMPSSTTDNAENWSSHGKVGGQNTGTDNYWSFDATALEPLGDQATDIQGKWSGCYLQSTYGYTFFSVLVSR